jgi:hypothetical protein
VSAEANDPFSRSCRPAASPAGIGPTAAHEIRRDRMVFTLDPAVTIAVRLTGEVGRSSHIVERSVGP